MYWESKKNKAISGGGPFSRICKLITINKGREFEKIKYACFRNYEDLKNILREYFLIYEDLKISLIYEKS